MIFKFEAINDVLFLSDFFGISEKRMKKIDDFMNEVHHRSGLMDVFIELENTAFFKKRFSMNERYFISMCIGIYHGKNISNIKD